MNFAQAAQNSAQFTRTENGAVALNTTSSKLLDFFSTVGALRNTDDTRIERLFADAYAEDPLFAVKIAFYGRDVRGGLGERETFRKLLKYMAKYHPEGLVENIKFIGDFGRWDDLYTLIDTPLEDKMWEVMKKQFNADLENLHNDKPISLLAKWIKTPDASSEKTRKLGILTAEKLGYPVYNFKRILRAMRKKIKIVEALMSTNQWSEVDYPAVPSRAMMIYRNAFAKHDGYRYADFTSKALNGEAKINSGTLYPYDIMAKVMYHPYEYDDSLEAQWRQLPNYVEPNSNVLVIADTSGSMRWSSNGRPLASAVGLAIYFAERNTGAYHNMWMSFSNKSTIHMLKGETLMQKYKSINKGDWESNTNLHRAFEHVLKIAIDNRVTQEEMPKALIVISDMEIDCCSDRNWSFYDQMEAEFAANGYQIPNVIFWNVESRHDIFHADSTRRGVQLVSGQSASTFKNIMSAIDLTPVEAMYKTIDSGRYDCLTIAK